MDKSDKVRIQYASKFARSSNYWKYSIGQNKGLKRLNVVENKKALEKQFADWVNADATRKAKYGNADTSGGIDRFWLNGGLRVTPEQQIKFLVRLFKKDLPFSERSMDIAKRIMIAQDTTGYVLRAKTGMSDQENRIVGWYVGYLETATGTYFFATCVQCSDKENPDFARSRKEITTQILKSLKLY